MTLEGFSRKIKGEEVSVYGEKKLFPEGLSFENATIIFADLNLTYNIDINQFNSGIEVEIVNVKGILFYTIETEQGSDEGSIDLSKFTIEINHFEGQTKSFFVREVEVDLDRNVLNIEY